MDGAGDYAQRQTSRYLAPTTWGPTRASRMCARDPPPLGWLRAPPARIAPRSAFLRLQAEEDGFPRRARRPLPGLRKVTSAAHERAAPAHLVSGRAAAA